MQISHNKQFISCFFNENIITTINFLIPALIIKSTVKTIVLIVQILIILAKIIAIIIIITIVMIITIIIMTLMRWL